MERLLQGLYERLGERYLVPFHAFLFASAIGLSFAAARTLSFYVPVETPDLLGDALVAATLVCLALGWATAYTVRRFWQPVVRWMRAGRGRDGAEEAWAAVTAFPVASIRPTLWRAVLVAAVPIALYVTVRRDGTPLEGLALLGTILAASVLPMVMNLAVLEVYLRPVAREVGRVLPLRPSDPHARRRSLRRRLVVSLPFVNFSTSLLVAVLATGGQDDLGSLGTDLAAALLVSFSVSLVLILLIAEALIRPLDDLTDGMARVQRGELGARVPVLSDDEVGELARSFNAMAADLQRARERDVSAREEERRRVRRDLHDGLGPTLAAVAMQLEAARRLLERDPEAAARLLDEARAEAGDMVSGVRRVVDGLRPRSLDELGLVGALEHRARSFAGGDGGPEVTVTAEGPLGPLPAAVEVAALRIAEEALTNVRRHAGASACRVALRRGAGLEVEVADDGRGLPAGAVAGVGLASMRARAAELGGTCEVVPGAAGGTVVRARLPLPAVPIPLPAGGPAGEDPAGAVEAAAAEAVR